MNKKNIWLHLGIALFVIAIAAIAGQIRSWQVEVTERQEIRKPRIIKSMPIAPKRTASESEPEVLVKFRPGVTFAQIKKLISRNNDRIEDEIETVNNLYSIDDLDNQSAKSVAAQYKEMTGLVVYSEPNYRIRLGDPTQTNSPKNLDYRPKDKTKTTPNDPMFQEQWALANNGQNGGKEKADIGALKAWLKTQGSEDVVVAVLDSGVDYAHQDLVTNMWFRPDNIPAYTDDELGTIDDKNGYNADANSGDPMDTNGHGTHCSGIIGAEGNNNKGISGVNWKVEIMPLKFMGRGGFGTTKDAIEAINYAVDRKKAGVNVRVINASWGSTQYSKALEDAIRAAGEAGILFVAAAGNNGTDNDNRPHYPSNYKLPNVISVAAMDRGDGLASFSNFGVKTVHIAAPGKDILSTWLNDQYREASGTSMATPQVAGVAALIVASNPKIKVAELRKRLLSSVDKLDVLNGKVENGGRLNAAKALEE
ncbi:MAG: S8 family serine peptidase [Pyrinomonadaceae bacterium]|nr:S8 family serine peptidase [Pyrinomonadaceae bacterium]